MARWFTGPTLSVVVLHLAALLPPAAKASPPARHMASPGAIYHVPYRVTDTNHLLVRARVNGKGPFRFVLDTGSPVVFLSHAAADAAGMAGDEDRWVVAKTLELEGGVEFPLASIRVSDPYQLVYMNETGAAGFHIDGVLGSPVISRFRITIDLSDPLMVWQRQTGSSMRIGRPRSRTAASPPVSLAALKLLAAAMTILSPHKQFSPPLIRGSLGLEVNEAAAVTAVLARSPADRGGLRPGDRIRAVTRHAITKPVRRAADLLSALEGAPAGETLTLKTARAGHILHLTLRTGEGF